MSLHAENNHLSFTVPGGLIGVNRSYALQSRSPCRTGVSKLPNIYTDAIFPFFFGF